MKFNYDNKFKVRKSELSQQWHLLDPESQEAKKIAQEFGKIEKLESQWVRLSNKIADTKKVLDQNISEKISYEKIDQEWTDILNQIPDETLKSKHQKLKVRITKLEIQKRIFLKELKMLIKKQNEIYQENLEFFENRKPIVSLEPLIEENDSILEQGIADKTGNHFSQDTKQEKNEKENLELV